MQQPELPKLDKTDQRLQDYFFLASAILLFIGLFLNLGVQPIYLEEPRRSFIAFELLANNNLLIPTELGEHYYKKPPFFNWVLLASVWLFGGFSEFALRLPTVLSTIGISLLIYWLGNKYVSKEFGQINAFLFLIAGGILFYFSALAEIDLFYSLITFASFASLFHFYQTRQFYLLFTITYFLGAIGALTKGPPSPLFLAFSIGAYLIYKKDFKRLFTLAHFTGIFLFLGITLGYLYIYSQYHPLSNFLPGLWGQSSEMTVLEQDRFKLVKHFLIFPLDTLKDTLPSALLIFFAIRPKLWKVLRENELVAFGVIVFLANIPVYMVSPGAKQRYIYMLYPFLFMAFSYCYLKFRDQKDWRFKTFSILSGILLVALALGSLAINFVPDLAFLSYRPIISLVTFPLIVLAIYFYWKRTNLSLATLIFACAVGRIIFDLTVLPQRAFDSNAQRDKALAYEIAEKVGAEDLYIYQKNRISFTSVYYLDVIRDKALVRNYDNTSDAYFLCPADQIDAPHEVYFEFDYKGRMIQLIKFKQE